MTTPQLHTSQATGRAMETQVPFSWIRTQDVQCGVYLKYTQPMFLTALRIKRG